MFQKSRLRKIEQEMGQAEDFEAWLELAQAHDETSGMDRWREREHTSLYDYEAIRRRLDRLRSLRVRKDDVGLLFALNEGIHGNMGGMGRSDLQQRAKAGTKHLIEDYVDEIVDALDYLADLDSNDIDEPAKLDFFYRANHCFGRTALMLSGGGTLGFYHLGVVKALHERSLLPQVISGASAGSLVAALLGTHTDDELAELFSVFDPVVVNEDGNEEEAEDQSSDPEELTELGELIDRIFGDTPFTLEVDSVRHLVEELIPDLTFQEAFERTGRQISISVAPAETHQTSRLLNAIASPNVYVRSAVMASCAVPGVFPPVVLSAKNVHGEEQPYLPARKWVDGSISDDLPAKRLGRLYGTNHTIVSLVNPLIVPFMRRLDESGPFSAGIGRLGVELSREALVFHRQVVQRYFPLPRFNMAVNSMHSVIDQTYTGDITIVPTFHWLNPLKWLSRPSEEELGFLVREGELSTWQHIDSIDRSTKISRKLDEILERYEREGAKKVRAARRRPRVAARAAKRAPTKRAKSGRSKASKTG